MFARPVTGATHIIDLESGKYRAATLDDCEMAYGLVDALENISYSSTVLEPMDVPKESGDIYALGKALLNTTKHIIFSPLNYKNFKRCLSMVFKIRDEDEFRKRPLVSFLAAAASPLSLARDVLLELVDAAKHKVPVMLDSSPMLGSTGPVTCSGAVVQQNAENLAINTFLQLIDPGTPVIYGPRPCPVDMKSGYPPLYGSVEASIMLAVNVELAHYYNLPSDVMAFTTGSKTHDEQTGFERAMCSILSAIVDAELLAGAGGLEAVATISYEQLVLDNEYVEILQRLKRGITVNDDTLAIDIIDKVGPAGNYLAEKHTRDHYESELCITKILDTNSRNKWEQSGKKTVDVVANEVAKKTIREHEPEKLEPDTEREINKILMMPR
jgi:trimethylamine--corrinoid protein Co-methyltransferase